MSRGGHNQIKGYYEGTLRIDIKHLQRIGLLKIDAGEYKYSWTFRGKDSGSVRVIHVKSHNTIFIEYVITDGNTGEVQNREDIVKLNYKKTGYGQRGYFICPGCGELTTTLCFRWKCWKCRKCQQLNYSSSQSNSRDMGDRYYRKVKKILKKLKYDGAYNPNIRYVSKPKRMRYETHSKLLDELRKYQELRDETFCSTIARRWPEFKRNIRS